jgi:hypothetical protein
MGVCALVCKRDRLREELQLLQKEMSNHVQYIQQRLHALADRQAASNGVQSGQLRQSTSVTDLRRSLQPRKEW